MRNQIPKFHRFSNCTKCFRDFTEVNPRACNGHRTECRECFNSRHRRWLSNNRDHMRAYKKAIYVAHPLVPRIVCKGCKGPLNLGNAQWKRTYCNRCWAAHMREYRKSHVNTLRAKENRITKNRVERYWQMILDAYGRACFCCGETVEDFLSLHHVNGDGGEHRKQRPGAKLVLLDVIREGYPRDKYGIACMNCNFAMRWGKKCPHELARLRIVGPAEVAAD